MGRLKYLMTFFVLLWSMLFVLAGPASGAANQPDCEALATYVAGLFDEALNQPITNVTAAWHVAAASLPEYCEVKGRIFPETDFAVRLPTAWNGRSIHFGGGGWDGSLGSPDATSLNLGYAGSASNGGHNGLFRPLPVFDGSFGLRDPFYRQWIDPAADNPYSCQKVVDFGNRAHRETPLVAKEIITQYYGSKALYSYYSGGSTGGREGLVEAQKNYDLFDGLYIAYPTGGHIAVCSRGLWDSIQGAALLPVFSNKAVALYEAVYGRCDGVDGLIDGVIDDPRRCNFDPIKHLPPCPGDVDAAGCFTLAQRQALREIYRGAHNSTGQLYIGTALSAEYLTAPGDAATSGFSAALYDILMGDLFRFIVFDPPQGPDWNMMTFNWESDLDIVKGSTCSQCYDPPACTNTKTYTLTDELDAVTLSPMVAPNMGGFEPLKSKGGKIIQYHGWADALVSPFTSSTLYDTMFLQMGEAETRSFWKLYMVPGMGHGTPGIGWPQTWTDGFTALVNWVEKDVEPDALIGTRAANAAWGWPVRTRPLCPYPEVARYLGTGSIDDAANFACVNIIPARVRIEPETINLKSNGVFTAFFTLPYDCDKKYKGKKKKNLDLTIVCEGAPAVKGTVIKKGAGYIAKFRVQDLINIPPGSEVTFTAYAIFDHHDEIFAIEGSDTVRVINDNKPPKPPKPCKNKNKCD